MHISNVFYFYMNFPSLENCQQNVRSNVVNNHRDGKILMLLKKKSTRKWSFPRFSDSRAFVGEGRREPTNTFAKLAINLGHLFMRRARIQDEDILDCG